MIVGSLRAEAALWMSSIKKPIAGVVWDHDLWPLWGYTLLLVSYFHSIATLNAKLWYFTKQWIVLTFSHSFCISIYANVAWINFCEVINKVKLHMVLLQNMHSHDLFHSKSKQFCDRKFLPKIKYWKWKNCWRLFLTSKKWIKARETFFQLFFVLLIM